MERYVCVHGHFYQPPRETPGLEEIEQQESAYPYHDWNERITAESYAPNAASRILDDRGRIDRIVNNYAKISFNFGPTLLHWLAAKAPATYRAVLEADRASLERYEGHGSALAQAYHHAIMPLANERDRHTQVRWGIADFERRFGRKPEGLWLPETAADVATLESLAEHGIRFTILAPAQARRLRPLHARRWRDAAGPGLDPTTAYEQHLPSGRSIALFFYDGPISRAIAFERLLDHGETFARRLASAFSDARDRPQLVHVATDGETYGHHHRFGEMALSWVLDRFETQGDVRLINYGAFLARHGPTHEVQIHEGTSWSCAHGVGRWRTDCGCSSGAHPGWTQHWRAPLREALDALRDRCAVLYEKAGRELLTDPWLARDAYVELLLDRGAEARDRFLGAHAVRRLSGAERVRVLKLLELQRHAMLMYTSCGWFFDDLGGIETLQVLRYAGRVVQLARELFEEDLEGALLERLAGARSNRAEVGTGRDLYLARVKPVLVDLHAVGAHYAVSQLFRSYDERAEVYGHTIARREIEIAEHGRARLAVGRIRVASSITEQAAELDFGVLHSGDHTLTGGVRASRGDGAYRSLADRLARAFSASDLPAVERALDDELGERTCSLKTLFRDERQHTLGQILSELMRFIGEVGFGLPQPFRAAASFVLDERIRAALGADELDADRVRDLVDTARQESVELDRAGLALALQRTVEREMASLRGDVSPARLERVLRAVAVARSLPFETSLWQVENDCYELLIERQGALRERAASGDAGAGEMLSGLRALGQALRIRVD